VLYGQGQMAPMFDGVVFPVPLKVDHTVILNPGALVQGNVLIDTGVPVALGTPLTAQAAPIPGILLLLGVGLIGLAGLRRYRERHPRSVLSRHRIRHHFSWNQTSS